MDNQNYNIPKYNLEWLKNVLKFQLFYLNLYKILLNVIDHNQNPQLQNHIYQVYLNILKQIILRQSILYNLQLIQNTVDLCTHIIVSQDNMTSLCNIT